MATLPLASGESSIASGVVCKLPKDRTGDDPRMNKEARRIGYTHFTLQSKIRRSYDTHIRTDLGMPSSLLSSKDYGIGNFSYDSKYLSKWIMPKAVRLQQLPVQVREMADDWSTSGAALDTALERIDELKADGMYRGWPIRKNTRLQVHHWPSAAGLKAQYPTIGCPISWNLSLPDPPARSDFTLPSLQHTSGFTMSDSFTMGMESPPPSPSTTASTAYKNIELLPDTTPKLATIDDELYPTTGSQSTPPWSGTNTPFASASNTMSATFDEHAWETYCNQWKAEHADIRYNALSRFKGTARIIENLISEHYHFGEYTQALEVFKNWWCSQKAKAVFYEDKVEWLEMPSEEEAKLDRKSKGLIV